MKDKLLDVQNEAILAALNKAIAQGPWDKSNFLRIIGKNLVDIRDNFINQLESAGSAQLKNQSHPGHYFALRSGQQEVFVSLYSSNGINLLSWEKIVANLPRQIISRPVYAEEEDLKALIKTKENKVNEAYVALYIDQTDILVMAMDKISKDKLGKNLISLKDNAVHLNNISRFVHLGIPYHFVNGHLVKSI